MLYNLFVSCKIRNNLIEREKERESQACISGAPTPLYRRRATPRQQPAQDSLRLPLLYTKVYGILPVISRVIF